MFNLFHDFNNYPNFTSENRFQISLSSGNHMSDGNAVA